MRYILLLTVIFLTACSGTATKPDSEKPYTTLGYSPEFKLGIPVDLLENSIIIPTDGLAIIFDDKKTLGGQTLIPEMDSLPEDFDMRLYADYILGLQEPISSHYELFKNSLSEIDFSYNIESLEIKHIPNHKIYSLCKNDECIAFVIKNDTNYQILTLNSKGFTREEFIQLIQGGLSA